MSARAKRFDYAVHVEMSGEMTIDGGSLIEPGEEWTPEHLVLAGLAKCTMLSLTFSAKRIGATVAGSAHATGMVTRREEDGRFALIETAVQLNVAIDPPPDDLAQLLHYAERGCFVGASLRATPTYRWVVNGNRIT
mgnify:CR=1 FL=1